MGDADLLVTLLTPQLGKIRAAASNARKSKRRFAGGLPGGAMGEATLTPGRRGGLWRLESFRTLADLTALGRDLDRFAYVAYLCELTDALVAEPEPDPRRFAALAEAIAELVSAGARASVLRRAELVLLDTLGLLPSLYLCVECGRELEDDLPVAFVADPGGVLCAEHPSVATAAPMGTFALARTLLSSATPQHAWAQADAAPREQRRALRDLTAALFRPQLRRPLRSLAFLAQVASGKSPAG